MGACSFVNLEPEAGSVVHLRRITVVGTAEGFKDMPKMGNVKPNRRDLFWLQG